MTKLIEQTFDVDLWRADRAGGDERFRPEQFALWLRVGLEAGEELLVQRLCELPLDLVVLAVHRLVLVLDVGVPGDQPAWEWEEFRLIARDPDVWDDLWTALVSLDRDHHDRLRAILERCCAMNTEYISGQGGFYQVLTAEEMLESDVAAARDDRRAAQGFISPADARAFLELARRGTGGEQRDPITRAYFRGLPEPQQPSETGTRPKRGGTELAALAEETALAARKHRVAPLLEQAMTDLRERDPGLFAARVRELGYLVNVWIAGSKQGRRPRPAEALEAVLGACEAGMRAQLVPGPVDRTLALAALAQTPADLLFRRGFRDEGKVRR
ncbi:MAG TPA: hypothetical protein VMT03_19930 [Polyangia bacterium]|nr:hypothetical protein [Polyangia bacterium]